MNISKEETAYEAMLKGCEGRDKIKNLLARNNYSEVCATGAILVRWGLHENPRFYVLLDWVHRNCPNVVDMNNHTDATIPEIAETYKDKLKMLTYGDVLAAIYREDSFDGEY